MKAIGLLAFLMGLTMGAPAGAQSVALGQQVWQRRCAECHALAGTVPPAGQPPPFAAIASLPSTTELSLRAFLYSPHAEMPNLILTPGETADVIAFILSLRK